MGQQSQQTQTTQTDVPAATGNEAQLLNLLSQLGLSAGGQLGDLSALAAGQMGAPTQADRDLVEQSVGASTDIARRQLEQEIQQLMAQMDEQLAARGIQGSSIEAVNRGQVFGRGLDQIANMLSQQQAMGAQSLMNLPFQRAQTQIGANQALMQRLTGTAGAVMGTGLQERLAGATTRTSQTQNPGMIDYLKVGQQIGQTAVEAGK